MTQTRSNNGKGGSNKTNNGGPSYFEEAKAVYARFRGKIAEAAEKKDKEFLDFRLEKIVGKFVQEEDRRGKSIVRFKEGGMTDVEMEMLVNASGLSFGKVLNGAIMSFPNVFGKNMDEPEKRCHVRTLTRAMALTVAFIVADEETARVAAEEKKFLDGLAEMIEKKAAAVTVPQAMATAAMMAKPKAAFEPKMVRSADGELDVVPVAVEPADESGAKDGTTGE